jgi:hypothetical protein
MAAAPAIISGVSAVGGLIGASSQAKKQKEALNEQIRAAETTRILNRMELRSQEQTMELNNQRQQQLLANQQATALLQSDLETQQTNLQNTQAQIEQDRQQVLNTQRVFQRKAAAASQASQVFGQLTQQAGKQEADLTQAVGQEAQKQSAMAGSKVSGGISSDLAAERLAMAVQNGQIDLNTLMNREVQNELSQLGYEYNVADIEARLAQSGLDYQQRNLSRVGELTGIQDKANKEGIATQSARNKAAMDYEVATSKTALAQAAVTNEATSNAQVSSLQTQKSATRGPSVFDWAATAGNIGLSIYAANPNNQAKRPVNNNQYILSNTKEGVSGAPSYIPASSMEGAPSYIPNSGSLASPSSAGSSRNNGGTPMPPYEQLDFTPTEMVFNRPRSSYGYANRTARSIFGRTQ